MLLFLYQFGHRVNETEGITKIAETPNDDNVYGRLSFVAN